MSFLWREGKGVALALALVLVVRTVAAEPYTVPTPSMVPTLMVGDKLVASKFAYGYSRYSMPIGELPMKGRVLDRAPARGDVIVFRLPRDTSETYVKRVIGLPGDRIQMRDGQVWINGQPAPLKADGIGEAEDDNGSDEPARRYVETLPGGVSHTIFKIHDNGRLDNTAEVTVPQGHLFVMGDNRDNSADSRVPVREGGVGLLSTDNLVGRVDAIVGSWNMGIRNQPVWTWLSGFRFARFFTAVH